jgi:hypothetical protein
LNGRGWELKRPGQRRRDGMGKGRFVKILQYLTAKEKHRNSSEHGEISQDKREKARINHAAFLWLPTKWVFGLIARPIS